MGYSGRALFSLALLLILFSAGSFGATVIVINDTNEGTYALEELRLSGDVSTNVFSLTGKGEVLSGADVKVYLLGPAKDIVVRDLKVNGKDTSVSFDGRGYFFIHPSGKFELDGELAIRTADQIRLDVKGPVNELNFDLTNGYAVEGDRYGAYDETVYIQRVMDVSTIVEGSYRYTFASTDSFYYVINFQSFGGDLGRQSVSLRNGESVSSVTGALDWEAGKDSISLDLKGDRAAVVIQGVFTEKTLRVPAPSGPFRDHRVLLESEPEKKMSVSGTAREIDLSEVPLPRTYFNGIAFLANPGDTLYVSIEELDTEPSLIASVSRADNRVAVTTVGSIVGEMSYRYANTGLDYLEVEVPGTPLYASTEGSAIKLTKEDNLLLAFPKTEYGNFEVVYFETRSRLMPISLIKVPLARTDLPISTAVTSIYLPKSVVVLETFGAEGGSEIPVKFVSMMIVLFVAVGMMLKKDKRFVAYFTLFSLALYVFNSGLLLLLMAGCIIWLLKSYVGKVPFKKLVTGGAVLLVIVLFLFITGGMFGGVSSAPSVRTYEAAEMTGYMAQNAPMPTFDAAMELIDGDESVAKAAITAPTKKGVLPVRLDIPEMGKEITVTNYLVSKERPLKLTVLAVSAWFKYLLYLAGAYAGYVSYKIVKGKE
ncbi:MAG: hypothetical protein ABH829_02770 [archaeon]